MLFYLIGIKGAGLSALASVLKEQGHIVRGVDIETKFYTEKGLKEIQYDDFNNMKLKPYYFYIIGNAYLNHSVTNYIKRMKYYFMTYPEFIGYYFKNYNFISICGSHGKTTTTKMLTDIVTDCSYIIGDGTGSGKNKNIFILESCEYRDTFLNYKPNIALILNVDYDHPDYFKKEEDYIKAFQNFSEQSKIVIANGDDKNINKIKKDSFITYGLKLENDVVFTYIIKENKTIIDILGQKFFLPLVGLHYAYDFVGAYLVSKFLGENDDDIQDKIQNFKLPNRRLQKLKFQGCDAILDYAHHPTEIQNVYYTVKELYKNRKIVCCFQPHTISRTKCFIHDFKKVLSLFDDIYLLPIFTSVREQKNMYEESKLYGFLNFKRINNIKEVTYSNENVYVFLGAGDIDTMLK